MLASSIRSSSSVYLCQLATACTLFCCWIPTATAQVVAQLAESPPVNAEAVNRIKSAIANGEYPINLDLISDALMDAYRDLKT